MNRGKAFLPFAAMTAAVLVALGCGSQGPGAGPSGEPAKRGAQDLTVPEATLVASDPMPLGERPIDLAMFREADVPARVTGAFSTALGAGYERPWLKRPGPKQRAYWDAKTDTVLTLDLGRPCYVSEVVVQPFTARYSLGEFGVTVVTDKNEEFATAPPCTAKATPPEQPEYDQPPEVFYAQFSPRYTQRLRFRFRAGSVTDPGRFFIQNIRVLGWPAEASGTAPSPPLSPTVQSELAANAANVARFSPEAAAKQVVVSDDRDPNGRFDRPWVDDQGGPPETAPYWCAPRPAWVEVDLGKACYVNAIRVQPYSEAYGVTAFYAKVIGVDGTERDTSPPCEDSRPAADPPGTGLKPPPLSKTFDPVLAQKFKLYFPRGGFQNTWVYVETIEILGVPADVS